MIPRLEAVWHGPRPCGPPTLVFLHEGLGSVSTWRDFPQTLADATGLGALVYSRRGYGDSESVRLPRPSTYMHDEAALLPAVLDAHGVRDTILFGHSDGASIALLHAATRDPRVRALILEAPHVFVEPRAIEAITGAREAYLGGDLRERLARHHTEVEVAFWGWNGAWLSPGFRSWNIEGCLPRVRAPILVIQSVDDPYGTIVQVEAIERQSGGPVQRCLLEDCGHSPHRDQPERTIAAVTTFLRALDG